MSLEVEKENHIPKQIDLITNMLTQNGRIYKK